jgi:uncharacterized protein (DUF983 family)
MGIAYQTHQPGDDAAPLERRPVWRSIRRGVACRCPNCGSGKTFRAYLKVAPACTACGLDLSGHRADDLPPYITIVIVGHIIVSAILFVATRWELPTAAQLAIWLPLTLFLALALLQPVKGAVVGLQWALRMHGFGEVPEADVFADPDVVATSGIAGAVSPIVR